MVESRRLLNLREGLFTLIKSVPSTLRHEPGVIVAEGDFVIVHGRFSGAGRPKSWIAADILRIVDGVLVEHWEARGRIANSYLIGKKRRELPCETI